MVNSGAADAKCEPVLIGSFDVTASGTGTRMLVGDLDGDGRMDLLMVQPDSGIDDRYVPHQVHCLTAYNLKGEILWQVGTPDPNSKGFGSDIPAQIYDIDQDGFNEVLCVMNKKFKVFDGRTGTLKYEHDLPAPDAHDCIIVANLTGSEYPRDIILKNRYQQMWAVDHNFNLLWTHQGNVGHYPWPYDLNQDGYDEVIAGYDVLDHQGRLLWSLQNLDDHADCILVGKVDANTDGVNIVVGGSVTVMYDSQGKEIWRYEGSVEAQHIALGRFRHDSDEVLVAGVDRINRSRQTGKDALFLLSSKGEELWKENRTTYGWVTIAETLNNWDGTGKDYIFAYRRGGGLMPALYDGYMNRVVTFPVDGAVAFADLFDRGQTDVIIISQGIAHIFSSSNYDLTTPPSGKPLKQSKRLYNATFYPGGEIE